MNIQYYGHSCFKITTRPAGRGREEITVFVDPFDKTIGLRPPQGQANVVLISHGHHDHSNTSALKGEPYVIDIPGEYSVRGLNIVGVATCHDKKGGSERGQNTAYVMESEDIRLCHLGDLGCELSEEQLDDLNGVDVLMIPVGGTYTLDGKEAVALARKINPRVIIPMHYKIKGSTAKIDSEKKFCSEMGNCPKERPNKINLKAKSLSGDAMQVVLMSVS